MEAVKKRGWVFAVLGPFGGSRKSTGTSPKKNVMESERGVGQKKIRFYVLPSGDMDKVEINCKN